MHPDTAIIRKYRGWMSEERGIEARKNGMPEEFVKVATAGVELDVARKSSDAEAYDPAAWAEAARCDMAAYMGRHNPVSSSMIRLDWFEVEFLRSV